ncbi:MAG TPA: hypothetical protein VNL16_03420 [Chloroflexota bacterium]|nr:hypothetical protein [Chloroflexota bacterium]
MIARPTTIGRLLRRTPVRPASVAALLGNQEAYLTFRRILRDILPDAETEILDARAGDGNRESARVWAFVHRVEELYFPCYEADEYEQLVYGIPFVRNSWSYERFHELDLETGELLLFTLCAQPYETGYDTRLPLLDAGEAHVPRTLLSQIPESGFTPADLHDRLDGSAYAAAAEFADWIWADTGLVFLDVDDEEAVDVDWTRENVLELTEQWSRSRALLDRIATLDSWLEADPVANFGRLLDAALGRDPHLNYERDRRLYACEITSDGLAPIRHDEAEPVSLPLDAAA